MVAKKSEVWQRISADYAEFENQQRRGELDKHQLTLQWEGSERWTAVYNIVIAGLALIPRHEERRNERELYVDWYDYVLKEVLTSDVYDKILHTGGIVHLLGKVTSPTPIVREGKKHGNLTHWIHGIINKNDKKIEISLYINKHEPQKIGADVRDYLERLWTGIFRRLDILHERQELAERHRAAHAPPASNRRHTTT